VRYLRALSGDATLNTVTTRSWTSNFYSSVTGTTTPNTPPFIQSWADWGDLASANIAANGTVTISPCFATSTGAGCQSLFVGDKVKFTSGLGGTALPACVPQDTWETIATVNNTGTPSFTISGITSCVATNGVYVFYQMQAPNPAGIGGGSAQYNSAYNTSLDVIAAVGLGYYNGKVEGSTDFPTLSSFYTGLGGIYYDWARIDTGSFDVWALPATRAQFSTIATVH